MDMNEYALEIMVQFHLAEMRAKAERVGISGALVRVGNVLLGLRGLSW